MSIEAKDRKTPNLVCVATIERVSHDGRLLVHFDGWSDHYNYWCDRASSDIHPPMWCGKNNKRVTPPKGERNIDTYSPLNFIVEQNWVLLNCMKLVILKSLCAGAYSVLLLLVFL